MLYILIDLQKKNYLISQHASRIQSKYWNRIPKITDETAAVPLSNNDKWMQYAELLLGIKQERKKDTITRGIWSVVSLLM